MGNGATKHEIVSWNRQMFLFQHFDMKPIPDQLRTPHAPSILIEIIPQKKPKQYKANKNFFRLDINIYLVFISVLRCTNKHKTFSFFYCQSVSICMFLVLHTIFFCRKNYTVANCKMCGVYESKNGAQDNFPSQIHYGTWLNLLRDSAVASKKCFLNK